MKQKLILLQITTLLFFLITTVFFRQNLLQLLSPTTTKAQTKLNASVCKKIGNNTAWFFGQGNFTEAKHTLALLPGVSGETATAQNIADAGDNTVIIRLIGEPYARNGSKFGDSIINISNQTGHKPFIVQASHNEYNCSEHPHDLGGEDAYNKEIQFTKDVINTVQSAGLTNVTFITSQIDFYCGNWSAKGYRSPQDYITGLGNIPGIKGISLPFYTGPEIGNSDFVLSLFQSMANLVNKPIYISESGPFRAGPNLLPSEDDFRDYVIGVQKVLGSGLDIQALLLFNSLELNDDTNFAYTKFFWDPACREAFRDSCNETEVVVETCFNGAGPDLCAQDPTIPIEQCSHNCQLICDGDAKNPCSKTPSFNCSIPYKAESFTDKELLPEHQETLMGKYLVEYLERAKISNGNKFELRGYIENADLCVNLEDNPNVNPGDIPRLQAACEDATGQTSVDLIPSELELAGITPANDTDQNRTETHSGLYFNPEAASKEGHGALEKLLSEKDWWTIMSEFQQLKNSCYYHTETPLGGYSPIPGHVVGYKDTQLWGKVRCANYVELNCPNCSGAFANEKLLFEQGIPQCRDGYTRDCQIKLRQIKQATPDVYQTIKQLRISPSAIMPIFVLTDELPGDQDQRLNGQTDNPVDLEEYRPIERIVRKIINYRGASENVNEVAYTTHYSSFGAFTGLDSQTLALVANNSLISLKNQTIQPNLNPPSEGFSNNPDAPFPYNHVQPPSDFIDKPRIRLLQKFANNYSSECMATWNEPVDRTTAETTGRLSFVRKIMDVLTDGNLRHQLEVYQRTDYDIQEYLRCAIFPKHNQWAQEYSHHSNQIFIPYKQQAQIIGKNLKTGLEASQPDTEVPRSPLTTGTAICKICNQWQPIPGGGIECTDCQEHYPQVQQPHQVKVGNSTQAQGDGLRETIENENSFSMPIIFPETAGFLTSFFKDTIHQYLLPHDTKYRCDDEDISYWQCLTRRGSDDTDSGSTTASGDFCPYIGKTTTIPSAEEVRDLICQLTAPSDSDVGVPGFLVRAIYDIEGSNVFGQTVPCEIDGDFGGVGSFQMTVKACRADYNGTPATDTGLCDFETSLTKAIALLKRKRHFAGTNDKPLNTWTYEDIYLTGGYYNGSGSNHCTTNPNSGLPNVGKISGQDASYCRYAAEAYDERDFWRCSHDPLVTNTQNWL